MIVELAAVEVADAPAVAALYKRERAFLAPFDPVRDESFYATAGQRLRLGRLAEQRARGAAYPFLIVVDGEIGGALTVSNVVRGAFRSANVGYFVARHLNGRGVATRSVALALERAYGELGLHRLEASTLLDNVGSQLVLRRNGFQTVGISRGYLEIAGDYRDHLVFARVADEPAARDVARAPAGLRMREAEERDARALSTLVNDVAGEPGTPSMLVGADSPRLERRALRALVGERLGVVLVAELGGVVVGRVDVLRDRHPGARHLAEVGIAVTVARRRCGVGAALVHAALGWCARHGVMQVEAQVFPANAASLAFLRRLGFDEVGLRRARFARDGVLRDVILLARSVEPEV